MFLNAVILILQEILEAALLVSVLLMLTGRLRILWPALELNLRWVLWALLGGALLAWIYAVSMPAISEWFDYVGQDVVNAMIQLGIVLLLAGFGILMGDRSLRQNISRAGWQGTACIAGAVALLLMREGSEIILYVGGILGQRENVAPVMLGGLMATGIGLSCGVLLYLGLTGLRLHLGLRVAMLLMALFAGNMASQAVLQLSQADWLPYTAQLWDSSAILPESGIAGQLLYALVGYEANPSLLQALAYAGAMLLIMSSPLFRRVWRSKES